MTDLELQRRLVAKLPEQINEDSQICSACGFAYYTVDGKCPRCGDEKNEH